ncbi:gamma-glutamyltransferase [Lacimicrobium alkaliphilum]|uniref:Glutathione hydrolase proenzyme n=1 Tax=Lacimicrobium alkaliphilum TaxID=1526571 RepID=A0ABQ1RL70_9ALTE|nr:gamma-glutamyltransferase [Lacimicrobium alkaliphilum]GGD70080.1 gamma-glutamyltransferase 1 [Lacimicrobium alkaliphilum]
MLRLFILVVLLVSQPVVAQTQQAAVAMPDSYSADVARQVLEEGGNAVDAAVAANFVLAVTLPEAGNIGGGGFMLIYKDNQADFLDYREKAPLAAHKDMYLDAKGNVIQEKPLYGILASGVPGAVMGMWQAHQKYGTKDWSTLMAPAIELAEDGFMPHPKLLRSVKRYIRRVKQDRHGRNFDYFFGRMREDQLFKQPQLAATLKRIAEHGPQGFYDGETARLITEFMQQQGGLITGEDLAAYEAKWRTPISDSWNGYQVLSAPPPSSGGLVLVQMLKMQAQLKQHFQDLEHNSAQYIHLLAELGKLGFADRGEYMGDPDFHPVPTEKLLDDTYIARRAAQVSIDSISVTEEVKPGLKESEDTTHYSVIDQWGNAVSNTTTINLGFGNGVVVEGAGFLLNNEMDDFSAKPGVPNFFGAIGKEANKIEPQKRMLSSMTPTILLKDNQVEMVSGSPGGTTIISSVFQSILNRVLFDMSADELVNAPRVHHQLLPKDVIRHHPGLSARAKYQLEKMGYKLSGRRFGDLQVISRDNNGNLDAASETSGRGKAMVF